MKRFDGTIAVVTGAARGIGEAIARRLAAERASAILADIDEVEAVSTAASIAEAGGAATAMRLNIGDDGDVQGFAKAIEARFGRCDILVNNAAINDTTPLAEFAMAHFRAVQRINLEAQLAVTLALLQSIRKAPAGRILDISSIMGLRGSKGALAYSTAKGGVVNMTRALACDLGNEGILVNTLAPGFIDTRTALLADGSGHEHQTDWFRDIYIKCGRIPLGRAGQPDDVAAAAPFFCSDDCRYVTGQVLFVDGGVSATF